MSEAVGKTLKIIAIAAFVVAFTFATGGLGTPLFAIGSTTVTLGQAAMAAYAIGSALDPPSIDTADFKGSQNSNLTLQADPAPVRWQLYGEAATGGTLIFRDTTGTDNESLWLVIALAGHECDSLTKFEWDGEEITFTSNDAVGKYNGKMFLWFMSGTEAQAAQSDLVAASSKWTSDHKGGGICYAVVRLIQDTGLFDAGLQEMRFTVKGAKAYDPRLDTTRTEVSGSGAHRVDDQSTWAWTDDSALITARYKYGYRLGGTLTCGMGIADNRIGWVDVAGAADDNEATVALNAGGTEPRYTCNGVLFPNRPHRAALSALVSSMAGLYYQAGGLWRMQSGVARTAINTRSTDDFIGPLKSRGQRDPKDKFNAVRGTFPDAAQRYEPTDYPSLRVGTAVIADGNQEHWLDLNLPFTTSGTMAQRISKINLMRTRMDRDAVLPLNAVGLQDAAGDTINIVHSPLNLNHKMRIEKWSLRFVNVDGGVAMVVEEHCTEEDDALIYGWDETTDEQVPAAGNTINRYDKEPYPATQLVSAAGTVGESVFDRVDSALENNAVLTQGVKVNQGDGVARTAAQGVAYDEGEDADAVSFTTAWDSLTIPEVRMLGGGITSSSTLTDPVTQIQEALAVTVSGFTIKARLEELTGTITPVTDTGATEDTTDVQWSMDKSTATEAYDDKYTFQFDVTVDNVFDPESSTWSAGQCTIGIYIDDGGGFDQYATSTFNGDTIGATTIYTNQTKTVTVDGVGTIAGKEFRIINETGTGDGNGTLDNFDSVAYGTAAAPSDETASPSGASPIKFQIVGGTEAP